MTSFRSTESTTTWSPALLIGGIAFATPDNKAMGKPAADGEVFTLSREADPKWLEWKPQIPLGAAEGD